MAAAKKARRVLIVEDEAAVRRLIRSALELNGGFECLEAADMRAALDVLKTSEPDLALIDWMLPGSSGLELVLKLRAEVKTRQLPIIMLTARGLEEDRLKGFQAGVDDYVVKPFSPRELVARINAVDRRRRASDDEDGDDDGGALRIGRLQVDLPRRAATLGERALRLRPIEMSLLASLMSKPGHPLTRRHLLSSLRGEVGDDALNVHVSRLRRKLSDCSPPGRDYGRCVETLYGVGYRFSPPVDEA